mmetsp:Transcript_4433/g.11324  ORF Transcript_4433/g.11324 Transcript_4433/m.11324 type:complete len:170 (-) Transcript_4433:84-593(-)
MVLWPLGKFVRVGVACVTSYLLVDACEEVSLWLTCRGIVSRAANASDELRAELGDPLSPGQYWDSSLRTTHRGNVLHCTIPVRGQKGGSDVQIKLVKAKGMPFALSAAEWWPKEFPCPGENLLYNHAGPGEWKVLVHYAVIGGAGALPKHFNLMEDPTPREAPMAKGAE